MHTYSWAMGQLSVGSIFLLLCLHAVPPSTLLGCSPTPVLPVWMKFPCQPLDDAAPAACLGGVSFHYCPVRMALRIVRMPLRMAPGCK